MRNEGGSRRALGVLLGATVVAAPLALGTVHGATRVVVFGACFLALAWTLLERARAGKRFPITVPLAALLAAAAATALQLIPLPDDVIAVLSPAAHEIFSLRGDYDRHPLSLDPSATVAELAKICAYLAFFAAATVYASRTERRRQLVFAVAGVATVVAVVGLVQAAVGAREILFFYKPRAEWGPLVRGTFVNPNHFGALMCLGAPCALAVALQEKRWRWLAFAATFVMDVAVVLSLARASIVAAFFGQALAFALDRLQLRRGADLSARRGALVLAVLVVVASLAVALAFGKSRIAPEVSRTVEMQDLRDPLSKLHVWERAASLVVSYPWTGVGRGAFEPAFTRVSDVGGYVRYDWAENGYLEAVVDWGVPAALLLFILAGWALVLAVRRLREDPVEVGALAAVVALAVHEAADFAVELPGVALPALALLATLFGRRSSEAETGRRRFVVRWWLLPAPVILALPLVFELRTSSAASDGAALSAASRDVLVPTERVVALGEAAAERHPADYLIRALVAERLARELKPEAIRWLNEAMYLNPTHPAPHLMAAEVLAAAGHKSQALVEYRLAAAGAPDPRAGVWEYVAARYPSIDDLLAATPDDARGLSALAKWLLAKNRQIDAENVFSRLVERDPKSLRALTMLAEMAIARKDAPAARARVDALLAVDHGPAARRLAVEERILAGDLQGAAVIADAAPDRGHDAFELDLALADALSAAGRAEDARARLDRVMSWPLDRPSRARLHEARAAIERRAGNEHQYQWEIEQRDRLINTR